MSKKRKENERGRRPTIKRTPPTQRHVYLPRYLTHSSPSPTLFPHPHHLIIPLALKAIGNQEPFPLL